MSEELIRLESGKIYRIKRDVLLGGIKYQLMYDEGDFIHVRVLLGPDDAGAYLASTRGEDGHHLGPGGGWKGESTLRVWPKNVEEVPVP